MKNILLPLHPDPGREARLQIALDVTRTLDAMVEGGRFEWLRPRALTGQTLRMRL